MPPYIKTTKCYSVSQVSKEEIHSLQQFAEQPPQPLSYWESLEKDHLIFKRKETGIFGVSHLEEEEKSAAALMFLLET